MELINRIVLRKRDKRHSNKVRRVIFGYSTQEGLLYKFVIYALLIILGFVFLYPILYMLAISFMSNTDLVDNTIKWIPSKLHFLNYRQTLKALDYWKTLAISIGYSGSATLCLLISSAIAGYGLSRFRFKGRKIIMGLILLTFIMPKVLFFIPTYTIMVKLKLTGNMGAILAPALFGQGEQSGLFILIFYQFFNMIPKSLEEAAIMDGANSFKIFIKIAIPMVVPAIIITAVYAFALYWNETFLSTVYLEGKIRTLPMRLVDLRRSYEAINNIDSYNNPEIRFTEAKAFAGTILSITPLIVMYAIVQRWFVASIDKTGITGE